MLQLKGPKILRVLYLRFFRDFDNITQFGHGGTNVPKFCSKNDFTGTLSD